jgi:hypothetical protein
MDLPSPILSPRIADLIGLLSMYYAQTAPVTCYAFRVILDLIDRVTGLTPNTEHKLR